MADNVKTIIIKHLRSIGAGGLWCPDEECGCSVDDLAPCDHINPRWCRPARRISCKEAKRRGYHVDHTYLDDDDYYFIPLE